MDISYIIVFVILIIGVLIWQLSQSRPRTFVLSEQVYPELDLVVLIGKKERKIHEIVITIKAKKEITIQEVRCELISEKREFRSIDLSEISPLLSLPSFVQDQADYNAFIPFEKLKEIITGSAPFGHTFRMVIKLENGKVFKSHELALSKYWKIYKADTGRYN